MYELQRGTLTILILYAKFLYIQFDLTLLTLRIEPIFKW